jgi:predicted permease
VAELQQTVRRLSHAPAFTLITALTLAIGIGATTAVFSVVNSVLIQPLPYPESDRLIAVWHRVTFQGVTGDNGEISAPIYYAYAEHHETFEAFGVFDITRRVANVTGSGEPEQVGTFVVTHGVLPAFGVRPALGRWFTAEDDTLGTPETVILSYPYWQRRFGGDPAVLGRAINVDSRPREVIGVMPRGFDPGNGAELILPQRFDRGAMRVDRLCCVGVARLKPGVTVDQANADLAQTLAAVGDEYGLTNLVRELEAAPAARPLKQDVVGDVGNVLWMLLGAMGFVLAIACANVANLLLVRADGRSDELATRAALGATPSRIALLLLHESVMLGLVGGLLGLAFAFGTLQVLIALAPANLPRLDEIAIDRNALVFTAMVSLLSGVVFGLVPALRHVGSRSTTALASCGRSVSASRERNHAQNTLVVVQFALAFVLLIGAGLMIRSLQALLAVEPGFSGPEHVQTLRVAISATEVPEPERVVRTQREMLERISAIPGVDSAAFATAAPMQFGGNMPIAAEGVTPAGEFPGLRRIKFASPGYFSTLGIPFLTGRDFTWSDVYDQREVAIVSAKMARETWGDENAALGKRIQIGIGTPWREVVGVVGDVREDGTDDEAPAMVYWRAGIFRIFAPDDIDFSRGITFVVRTDRAGTESLIKEVQDAVWGVNRNLPVASVRTLQEIYAGTLASESFTLVMLGIAGGMALTLGVVGIYGVVSYMVARRHREIGLRLALGARSHDLQRLFVARGLVLGVTGVALGVAAAAGLTRLASSLLFEVSPVDPPTYVAGAVVLLAAAVLASYVPIRRALGADPVAALKVE